MSTILSGRTRGFTIVELMIVIVVIAILASITIVSYSNIQRRAQESAAQSDLRNLQTKVMEYVTFEGGYPDLYSEASKWGAIFDETTPQHSSGSRFVICESSDGYYYIAAWQPLAPQDGERTFYIATNGGGVRSMEYVYNGSSTGHSLCEGTPTWTSDMNARWSSLL